MRDYPQEPPLLMKPLKPMRLPEELVFTMPISTIRSPVSRYSEAEDVQLSKTEM